MRGRGANEKKLRRGDMMRGGDLMRGGDMMRGGGERG